MAKKVYLVSQEQLRLLQSIAGQLRQEHRRNPSAVPVACVQVVDTIVRKLSECPSVDFDDIAKGGVGGR